MLIAGCLLSDGISHVENHYKVWRSGGSPFTMFTIWLCLWKWPQCSPYCCIFLSSRECSWYFCLSRCPLVYRLVSSGVALIGFCSFLWVQCNISCCKNIVTYITRLTDVLRCIPGGWRQWLRIYRIQIWLRTFIMYSVCFCLTRGIRIYRVPCFDWLLICKCLLVLL